MVETSDNKLLDRTDARPSFRAAQLTQTCPHFQQKF